MSSQFPEIPGYRYDPSTNRYYRIESTPTTTRDQQDQQDQQFSVKSVRKKKSSITAYLRQYQTGKPISKASLIANRLEYTPVIHMTQHPLVPVSQKGTFTSGHFNDNSPLFCVPTSQHHAVYTFTSGKCVVKHFSEAIRVWYWCPRNKKYAAIDHRYPRTPRNQPNGAVRVVDKKYGYNINFEVPVPIHAQIISAVGVDNEMRFIATAYANKLCLHKLGRSEPRWYHCSLNMSHIRYVDSHEINTLSFMGKSLLAGTRSGRIYAWDHRETSYKAHCHFTPSGRRCSIVDIKQSACDTNLFYVSTMGNKKFNLAVWDRRKMEDQAVVKTFTGHPNSHKHIRFDLDDAGSGLLASPGDDGLVRLWDCSRGGDPVAELQLERPITFAQLCGWDQQDRKEYLGMTMITSNGGIMMKSMLGISDTNENR